MAKILVVGAGNMGCGIAQKIATEGMTVFLADNNAELAAKGIQKIEASLDEGVRRKIFTPGRKTEILGRIHPLDQIESTPPDLFLALEVVFEDLEVKVGLFQKLHRLLPPEVIFASNTSSLSISTLATASGRPDHFLGLHFFYHPAKNRLLEIIPLQATPAELSLKMEDWARRLGKVAITVGDSAGFCVNRFFVPFLNEAARVLGSGVASLATIEAACKEFLGIGMGPFELMNITGIPIAYHSTESLARAFGSAYLPVPALKTQFSAGTPWNLNGPVVTSHFEAVQRAIFAPLFLICGHLIDAKVCSVEDIEIGAKVGLRWRKGPFSLMNELGGKKCADWGREALQLGYPPSPFFEKIAANPGPLKIRSVKVEFKKDIAVLTLNRPEAMNALDPLFVQEITEEFDRVQRDPNIKVVAFAGSGKAFIAGADIKFFLDRISGQRLSEIVQFTEEGQNLLAAIARCPKPTVALVHGLALGGGLEFALACRYLIAAPKASMAFPETGIGIYPALGGTQRPLRRVGLGIARYLILSGAFVDGITAAAIGLADDCQPVENFSKTLELIAAGGFQPTTRSLDDKWRTIESQFARLDPRELFQDRLLDPAHPLILAHPRLGKKAPLAIKFAMDLIERGEKLPLEQAIPLELDHLLPVFCSRDALTGLSSLVGGPPPTFIGE